MLHAYYFIIPICAIAVAMIGSRFAIRGVKTWYPHLKRPSWTPPGMVIGGVWTVIYILTALSALMVWNIEPRPTDIMLIGAVFVLNALVNLSWSYFYFTKHKMGFAIWVSLFLDLTVIALIQLIVPLSAVAAWLLVPYAAWVTFASYLNYRIWAMNGS